MKHWPKTTKTKIWRGKNRPWYQRWLNWVNSWRTKWSTHSTKTTLSNSWAWDSKMSKIIILSIMSWWMNKSKKKGHFTNNKLMNWCFTIKTLIKSTWNWEQKIRILSKIYRIFRILLSIWRVSMKMQKMIIKGNRSSWRKMWSSIRKDRKCFKNKSRLWVPNFWERALKSKIIQIKRALCNLRLILSIWDQKYRIFKPK